MSFASTLPATSLEAGDRFEVFLSADGRTIGLPESFVDHNLAVNQLLSPNGKPLSLQPAASRHTLELTAPLDRAGQEGPLWLEYLGPGRFQLHHESTEVAPPELPSLDPGVQLHFSSADEQLLHLAPGSRHLRPYSSWPARRPS